MSNVSTTTARLELSLVDNITAPIKQIETSIERLKAAEAELGAASGIKRMGEAVQNLRGGFQKLTGSFSKMQSNVMSIGKTVIGAASSFAKTGDAVAKLSKETGLSVEELQELRYAAESSDVSTETFNESMKAFSKGLADARKGTGPLYSALKDTNPELLKSALAAENTGGALELLMGSMGDVKKADFTPEFLKAVFGKKGGDMKAFADMKPEEIAKLRKEVQSLGVVMSKQDAGNSGEFVETFTKLNKAITGVKNVVVAALLPAFTILGTKLTEVLVNNRDKIEVWAQKFGEELPGAIENAIKTVMSIGESFKTVIGLIETFTGPLDLVSIALGGFAAIKLAPLITSILDVGGAVLQLGPLFARAISTIMGAMGPVGWAILGIGLVVGEIIAEWDKFKAYWQNAWNEISSAFDQGWVQGIFEIYKRLNPLKLMMDGIEHLTNKYLGFSPTEIVTGWVTSIANLAISFYEQMKQTGANLVNGIVDGISSLGSSIKQTGTEMLQGFVDSIASFVDTLKNTGSNLAKSIVEGLSSLKDRLKQTVAEFYESMKGMGASMVQGILDGLSAAWSGLKSWLSSSITKLMPKKVLEWIGWDDSSSPAEVPDVVSDLNGKSPALKAIKAGEANAKPTHVDQSVGAVNMEMHIVSSADPKEIGEEVRKGTIKGIAETWRKEDAQFA